MKSPSKKHTYFMIGSIVAAFVFSWMAPEMAKHTKVGGEIFLRCLMMVVVPLVMTSVMSGILGLGDVRKLGKPGGAAVL
ncbi:dicarboxylate/amino acid:cation symporter, partial [bacterium]|nr:dicarboxylate/amino acid:cation symporter [bacterium]